MESDGFTLVKRARGKRKMLPQLIDPKLSKRDGFVSGECALSLEELEHQMTLFRGRFPHRHIDSTIEKLQSALDGRRLSTIRIIGVGNFGNSIPSTLQLILAEAIRNRFAIPSATFQDPVITIVERDYLQKRGIRVLPSDGRFLYAENDVHECLMEASVTIYYMIHCEHFMYDRLIAGIPAESLGRSLIVGNDFRNYASAVQTERFRQDFRMLCDFADRCTTIPLDIPLQHFSFSDTCIMKWSGR